MNVNWFALSIRLYRILLLFYPSAHRQTYGDLMMQVFRDQCRAVNKQGIAAWFALWRRTFIDALVTIGIEHLEGSKVNIMQSLLFKNQPDRLTGILFLLPGLLASLFYVLTIYSGESIGYMMAAVVGLIGFGLGFLKFFRRVKIWQPLFLGFAIGGISLFLAIIASPSANLGIGALRSEPWPMIRSALAAGVCLGIILLLGRLIDRSRRLYWIVAAVLLANGLIWAALMVTQNEINFYVWDLNWTWGYSAAILATVALSIRMSKQSGILALLAVIAGLGTIASINLTIGDVATGKTPFGQITLLMVYLFPLVICPAWLLFAPTWQWKKYGVLLSWAVMFIGMVLVMPILDQFLQPHFFGVLRPLDVVRSIAAYAPLLLGLWLAFALYERQFIEPQIVNTPHNNDEMVNRTVTS